MRLAYVCGYRDAIHDILSWARGSSDPVDPRTMQGARAVSSSWHHLNATAVSIPAMITVCFEQLDKLRSFDGSSRYAVTPYTCMPRLMMSCRTPAASDVPAWSLPPSGVDTSVAAMTSQSAPATPRPASLVPTTPGSTEAPQGPRGSRRASSSSAAERGVDVTHSHWFQRAAEAHRNTSIDELAATLQAVDSLTGGAGRKHDDDDEDEGETETGQSGVGAVPKRMRARSGGADEA